METPTFIFLGALVAVFIVGGLVFAFVLDRRRNERVAHDPERTEDAEPLHRGDGTI